MTGEQEHRIYLFVYNQLWPHFKKLGGDNVPAKLECREAAQKISSAIAQAMHFNVPAEKGKPHGS